MQHPSLYDREKGELWIEYTSVSATYILLAAEHYGIGACWNQIRDGQELSAGAEIRKISEMTSRYEVLCVIAMGLQRRTKDAACRKRFETELIY